MNKGGVEKSISYIKTHNERSEWVSETDHIHMQGWLESEISHDDIFP